MNLNKILWGVIGVLVALGLVLGFASCVASCKKGQGQRAAVAGAESVGGSKALKAEAAETGKAVAEADNKVTAAAANVGSALEGLRKLRARPGTGTRPQETPSVAPGPLQAQPLAVPEAPDNRDAIIAQQDVVIQAMAKEIEERKAKDLLQQSQVRQLEGALRLETDARIQAEMRAKAAEGLARANLLKGRVQGFLVGAAAGGLGGVALAR